MKWLDSHEVAQTLIHTLEALKKCLDAHTKLAQAKLRNEEGKV